MDDCVRSILQAGIRSGGLSLSDNNFLGTGQQVAVSYNYSSDRVNPNGAQVQFVENRLFDSRWHTEKQYKNSEDLCITTALIEYPFYSEETNWSGGLYVDDGRQKMRLYNNWVLEARDYRSQDNEKGWLIYSNGVTDKVRLGVGMQRSC